jgi:outer membrane cobalamin receptor
LQGYVLEKRTKIPVSDTYIFLNPGDRFTTSNQSGEYKISEIPAGKYTIEIKRVGYKLDGLYQIDVDSGEVIRKEINLVPMVYSATDAIVVSATREKSTTMDIPHAMSLVPESLISLQSPLNSSEILNNIQGTFIKDYGGLNGLKTISMRGSSAEQVLVMLNGKRLNNPQTGQIDLGTLLLDGIERVEILRGGSSAIYGADAVGGVVNLITAQNKKSERFDASFNFLGGSFKTRSFGANLGLDIEWIKAELGYDRSKSDGDFSYEDLDGNEKKRQNNDITSHNVFADIFIHPGQSPVLSDIELLYQYYTSERGSPGSLEFASTTARQWDTRQNVQITLKGQVFNPLHKYQVQGFWRNDKTRFEEPEGFFATDARNRSTTYGLETHIRSTLSAAHALTYGVGLRKEAMQSNQFPSDHERDLDYFFLQDESNFDLALSQLPFEFDLIPAVRFDQYSDFGSRWSPKIGANLKFISEWQGAIKINAGSNFRAPTFNELYWPESAWSSGNPDLKPERGIDWDAGINLRFPALLHLKFDLVYFDIRMKDLIQWQTIDGFSRPANVNKSRNMGIELGSSIQFIENLVNLSGNYTYLDARNKSENEKNNHYLTYRPRHSLNLTFNLNWKFFSFNYDFRHVGRRFTDEENTHELAPYDISDITFRFNPYFSDLHPSLSFQVKNIFDVNYEILRYQPLPGREYRIRLEIGYQ